MSKISKNETIKLDEVKKLVKKKYKNNAILDSLLDAFSKYFIECVTTPSRTTIDIKYNISNFEKVSNIISSTNLFDKVKESGGHKVFNYKKNKIGEILRFTSTGKKSAGFTKANGGNIDDLRECTVAVCLDVLLNNKNLKSVSNMDTLANEVSEIVSAGKLSKNLEIKTGIKDILNFWENEREKFGINLTCAKTIVKNLGKYKLEEYKICHKNDTFNKIKTVGKKLSHLSEDKWNPADIFLVKQLPKSKDEENIIEYNNFISNPKNVIGISLKESEHGALHGAFAVDSLAKYLGFKENYKINYNSISEKLIQEMNWNLSLIQKSKYLKDKVNLILSEGATTVGGSLLLANSVIKPNFYKSIPIIVEFLGNHYNDIEKVLKAAYFGAMSSLDESCDYHKVEGDKYEFITSKNNQIHQITLDNVYIPLDGQCQVIFKIEVSTGGKRNVNEQIKLQCRTKNTLPQFIIIKTNYTPPTDSTVINLNSVNCY